MADKLRTLLTAVNTWLVLAGAALAVAVNELAPLAELHPAFEWAVRVAGAGLVVLEAARRVVARSTVVPPALRGLQPDVDGLSASWIASDGGRYSYTPPGARSTGSVGTVRLHPSEPPPDSAA